MKTRSLAVLLCASVALGSTLTGCVADVPSDDAAPPATASPVAPGDPTPTATDVGVEGDRGDEIGLRLGTEATEIYHDAGEFEGRNILNWGQIHPGDVLRFVSGR